MHRAVMEACLPCVIAIAVAFAIAVLLIKLNGARWDVRRLLTVHRCEEGGVQSLAFVLTLPFFIMIMMFIVQISQLMVGVMVVNYAAFAAARSAIVWVPAQVGPDGYENIGNIEHFANRLPAANDDGSFFGMGLGNGLTLTAESQNTFSSVKCQEIFTAAAMACAPICPSRPPMGQASYPGTQYSEALSDVVVNTYATLIPQSQENARIPDRLRNKVNYSFQNTIVNIAYEDPNNNYYNGPTYKPVDPPPEHPAFLYLPNDSEIGWQDRITVTVAHNFAMLPGPGRMLARMLVSPDGNGNIPEQRLTQDDNDGYYKLPIVANATLTNEGLQSIVPYEHPMP